MIHFCSRPNAATDGNYPSDAFIGMHFYMKRKCTIPPACEISNSIPPVPRTWASAKAVRHLKRLDMSAVLWQVFIYYLGGRYHTRFIDTCCIVVIGTLLYRKWSLGTVETHLGRSRLSRLQPIDTLTWSPRPVVRSYPASPAP